MARGGTAAGVRARRPAHTATDREVGVVAAVLAAGSEKAAAHRLGLSHSTVKHHLANARSKLGATSTAQLVWILPRACLSPTTWPSRTTRSCKVPFFAVIGVICAAFGVLLSLGGAMAEVAVADRGRR